MICGWKRPEGASSTQFLNLRAKKPLEKITVKELCQLARINKSTFYTHYPDIFALSHALEGEVVEAILADIPHPEGIFDHTEEFTRDLFRSCNARSALIQTLFSGSREGRLIETLEAGLKELAFQRRPEYRQGPGQPYCAQLCDLRGLLRIPKEPGLWPGSSGRAGGPSVPAGRRLFPAGRGSAALTRGKNVIQYLCYTQRRRKASADGPERGGDGESPRPAAGAGHSGAARDERDGSSP